MSALQCKDIPTKPILERIWDINRQYGWAFRFASYDAKLCPLDAFPDGTETPDKLVVAKMRNLIKAGLVQGCPCGCRGDYVVSRKGCELIGRPWHGTEGY